MSSATNRLRHSTTISSGILEDAYGAGERGVQGSGGET